MIKLIKLGAVASFTQPTRLEGLATFNFVYGRNGTGKTTLSRVIAGDIEQPGCGLGWVADQPMQTLVYNTDYIRQNFAEPEAIKGIFTLGQANSQIHAQLEQARGTLASLEAKILETDTLLFGDDGKGGMLAGLTAHEEVLKKSCWEQKKKHAAVFSKAFRGYLSSQDKFKTKILEEAGSNQEPLLELEVLQRRAHSVFQSDAGPMNLIPVFDYQKLLHHESNPILGQRLLGNQDETIAAMIQALGNSDWVRQGSSYYQQNNQRCPFCQQDTTQAFSESLAAYFDEAFINQTNVIVHLQSGYLADSQQLSQQLNLLIDRKPQFLNVVDLEGLCQHFSSVVNGNLQKLAAKRKEPSQAVQLDTIGQVGAGIVALIEAANQQIRQHNQLVANLKQEKAALSGLVWKYLVEIDLKDDLRAYHERKEALTQACSDVRAELDRFKQRREAIVDQIRGLEKQVTSMQPTIDGINQLLAKNGFHSFSIAPAQRAHHYRIVRADGSEVADSLSEGEKRFLTFLYFYHSLWGSHSDSGTTTQRVVVFDDPVTSLDDQRSHLVGRLIQGLFDVIRRGESPVRQVFIMAHDKTFIKQVSHEPDRDSAKIADASFWVVRKLENHSVIEPIPAGDR